MEINVLISVPEPNMEMMEPEHVNHVLKIVTVVPDQNQMNVLAVPPAGSYTITNVSNHAQTTIMETTENVNHVMLGVKHVPDLKMETHVLVKILTILIPME